MAKIVIIGAGSVVFARRLVTDVLTFPSMQDSCIALVDINAQSLQTMAEWTEHAIAQAGLKATVQATTDRRAALAGADYVIIAIRVGGMEGVMQDFEITSKYGVDHSVGDTMGPGGVFYFLRNGSEIVRIAQEMEELCPNALMLNYTNPMVMICWAVNAMTSIRCVGLCHSVQGTAHRLADYIGAPREEVRYWTAGINHMAWYLRYEWKGQDAYPLIFAAMEKPEIYERDPVRFEILRHFGAFVTESSRHMSEYVPYFRRRADLLPQYGLPSAHDREWERWATRRDESQEKLAEEVRTRAPIELNRSNEFCAFILNAIESNIPYRFNGNVHNGGVITNLPVNAVVEVPCLADGLGVHGCFVGDLPSQLAALNRTNLNVQEVIVDALRQRKREAVYWAVQLDPLTAAVSTLDDTRKMVDELFAAHEPWLPF